MTTDKKNEAGVAGEVANMVAGSAIEDATAQLFERLKTACGAQTDTALGVALGISQASVAKAKSKGKIPPDWIITISYKFGVSADWLIYGTGSVYDSARTRAVHATAGTMQAGAPLTRVEVTNRGQSAIIQCDSSEEIIMVPMVEARLSAGTGSFETSGDQERRYAFRLDFLRRKGMPSQMVLMRVAGISMEPDIKNGDVVLIDQSQTAPIPGRIYAVGVEDLVYLKEVNAKPGKLVMTSYNEAYPPLEVDARGDFADGIRIIGRGVWVGRELK